MKRALFFASALCLITLTPPVAHAWIRFLDGGTLPASADGWQSYHQPPGTEGDTLVVDFFDPALGAMNQALRINSLDNANEWFQGPLFADEVVAAARFKTVAFSGTDSENLLAAEVGHTGDHSAAPSITIVTNHYKLWSYTEGTYGTGIGGVQILDLGPVVLDQLHTAYIYAHKDGHARLWWDGTLVFDAVAPAPSAGGQDGYMEWGSGFWQYLATTTIDFDWVGFGDITDLPQKLLISRDAGSVVISWDSSATPVYVLQSTASLSPVNWKVVTNAVGVVSSRYTVTNAVSSVAKFYRLTKLTPNVV